jgi:hypothetical protein
LVSADPHSPQTHAPDQDLVVVPSGVRDVPTVAAEGRRRPQLEGVVAEPAVVQADHRGTLIEAVNFDHPFWEEPVLYAYTLTVAPGRIKGWGMHKFQTDRYVALTGRLRLFSTTAAPTPRPSTTSPNSPSPMRRRASCASHPASGMPTRTSARRPAD